MALMKPFTGLQLSTPSFQSSALKSSTSGLGPSARNFMRVASRPVSARCLKDEEQDERLKLVDRRDILKLGLAGVVGSTLSNWVPSNDSGIANAADITQRFQRAEFLGKVKDKLRDVVGANQNLIPDLMKLALNDALTYDKATKTGGANGSIRFELDRPENAGLELAFKLLEGVKAEVDAELTKFGPITWADLIQLGAESSAKRTFINEAIRKCGGKVEKGLQLYTAYGSTGQWGQFEKQLGRADATGPDPEGRVLIWDKASPADIAARFGELGIKPRYITVLSAFLGPDQLAVESKLATDTAFAPYVKKYQESRETVSETEYEVDLITTFSKISVLGQAINYEAYTSTLPRPKLKF